MIFCFDLDNTICELKSVSESYLDVLPKPGMPELLQRLKAQGHRIIISTSRHMKTCNNNVPEVVAKQGYLLFQWLEKHEIPYDELDFGKPLADLYVDDKGFRFESSDDLEKFIDQM